MAFFTGGNKSVLGIDVGAGGVKLVEFRHDKGRPMLHTYAYVDHQMGPGAAPLQDPKEAGLLMKKILKQARTTTMRAVAGLPIASVFSSIISVPASSGKELREAIEWQAKKLIPLPLTEMVLDWKLLTDGKEKSSAGTGLLERKSSLFAKPIKTGPPELGKRSLRILLTSASKKLVSAYTEFAKAAGLELIALETEAFGLVRSLVGKDTASIMVIDFGTLQSNIVVVDAGIPVLTRSISLGGGTITRTIASVLGIPESQAEQMKRDVTNLSSINGGGNAGEMPAVLAKVLEPLLTEVRFSLNLYKTQQGEAAKSIEKIVLTGGSAQLPFLSSHLAKTLNINTYVGDPWARVLTHEDLRDTLEEMAPRFSVAIGLAMRDFE